MPDVKMIIINADDWGRSTHDTDATLRCYERKRITSVSAMVFMPDSERGAELARESGMDVGLHLNFTEEFAKSFASLSLREAQARTSRFLNRSNYAVLLYNPLLRKDFLYLYRTQAEEFMRLYGCRPSHIDGHQHMHLCANVLFAGLIPKGTRVRRSHSFLPREKGWCNWTYRRCVDALLLRRHRSTDYFFSLSQFFEVGSRRRVIELARNATVEIMTHPRYSRECDFLMSDNSLGLLEGLELGSFRMI